MKAHVDLEALDRAIADMPAAKLPALVAALSARVAAATSRLLEALPLSESTGLAKAFEENLPVEEAARRLGMSKDWLYRHAEELPFANRIGRRLLFSARGLERWLRQRQRAE